MYQLSQTFRAIKGNLKPLNSHLVSYAQYLQLTRNKLKVMPDMLAAVPLNQQLIEEEKYHIIDLHKYRLVEEKYKRQKFRATWI